MKNKDKIIIVFLVSAGIFSITQATQYIKTLSLEKKTELISVAKSSDGKIVLCSGVWEDQKTKTGV
jgi:hypothetical protein